MIFFSVFNIVKKMNQVLGTGMRARISPNMSPDISRAFLKLPRATVLGSETSI